MNVIYYQVDYNCILSMQFVADALIKNSGKNVIFWAPDEVDTWQRVKQHKNKINDLCKKTNTTAEFWEGNHTQEESFVYDRIKVVNWPNFCIALTLGKYEISKELKKTETFDHLFVSLNRSALPHKCFFIDTLCEHDLIKNNLVTWHKLTFIGFDFKHFDNKQIILDDISSGVEIINYPPYYHRAFMDLVCESFSEIPDISEKTYKAIAAKKPFLSLGYKGLYKKLQDLGFVLYDEIFDYEFDEFYSYEDRVRFAVQQIKNLQGQDLKELKKSIQPKLEHNYKNLINLGKQVPVEAKLFGENNVVPHYVDVFDYIKRDRHHHNFVL
jgi:hypothetical protein